RGVINNVVEIDLRVVDVGPGGLFQGQPVPVSLESPFEEPFGLFFLSGNQADYVLIQAAGDGIGGDVGDEAPLIFLIRKGLDSLGGFTHGKKLLNCWSDTTLSNPYFLVKIAHSMDAVRG